MQGNKIIEEILASGNKVVLADIGSVSKDSLALVSAGMGSPAAAKFGWRNEHLPAFDLLEKYLGKEANYVVPLEIGAGNLAVPMHTVAFRHKYLVDGDGAGRAIPEIELTSFAIYGVPVSPMSITDWEGDGAVLFVKDSVKAEKIARSIAAAFKGNAGIALYAMTGEQLTKALIAGSVSLSRKVGRILREFREKEIKGEEVVKTLRRELNGYILGLGEVTDKSLITKEGFDFGLVEVRLKEGGILRIISKNENIAAERNGKIVALMPDLICTVSLDGTPLTNVDIQKGMKVGVIGLRANDKLRSVRAIEKFRHLYKEAGLEIEYKPLEELNE